MGALHAYICSCKCIDQVPVGGTGVLQATQGLLLKRRKLPHQVYRSFGAVIFALALCILLLGALGGEAPPPRFKISETGLLEPTEYPLWQQMSDRIADRKYVLLTFDDGPGGHGLDEKILATLSKHRVHAIFFEVCNRINDETSNVPRDIVAKGNILGNHSYDHLDLTHLHGSSLVHQIVGCSDTLEAISGTRPRFLRPPWGQTSPAVLKVIRSAGMQQTLWDANSGDSWLKNPQKIIKLSIKEVSLSRASILLMHSRATTASALDALLTNLQRRGVRFILPVRDVNPGRPFSHPHRQLWRAARSSSVTNTGVAQVR